MCSVPSICVAAYVTVYICISVPVCMCLYLYPRPVFTCLNQICYPKEGGFSREQVLKFHTVYRPLPCSEYHWISLEIKTTSWLNHLLRVADQI